MSDRRKRGPVSATDLMAELEADPEFVARREQQDRELARKVAERRRIEAPLVEDLRGAGVDVESAWDLVNTAEPYPRALPILLEHLPRSYPDRVRAGMARALAVRDAKFAWPTLTALYDAEPRDTETKDGLAAALAAASDSEVIDDVIARARDPRHGPSRMILLSALKRSRAPHARAALDALAADPELTEEARRLLKPARRAKRG